GTESYGTYIFALTLVYILLMPVEMGLPALIQRQIAIFRAQRDWPGINGIIRWSVGFVALTFTVIALVATGCLLWRHKAGMEGDAELYLMSVLLIAVLGITNLSGAILTGLERVVHGTMPDMVIRPALLLASIFGLAFFADLTPFRVMTLHVISALLALLCSLA